MVKGRGENARSYCSMHEQEVLVNEIRRRQDRAEGRMDARIIVMEPSCDWASMQVRYNARVNDTTVLTNLARAGEFQRESGCPFAQEQTRGGGAWVLCDGKGRTAARLQ